MGVKVIPVVIPRKCFRKYIFILPFVWWYRGKYYLWCMGKNAISIDIKPHFKQHLDKQALKKGLNFGTFIKAVLKKHTKYKEPEVI